MIKEKIREIVEGAVGRLATLRRGTQEEVDAIVAEAKRQAEAIEALGVDFPSSLDALLDRCNGGRGFMVKDFALCGLQRIRVDVSDPNGCGHSHDFYSTEGPMIPMSSDIKKVRVVIMVMPVKE